MAKLSFEKDYEHASAEWDLTVKHIEGMVLEDSRAAAWYVTIALVSLAHESLGHKVPFSPEDAWKAIIKAQSILEISSVR